MTAVSPDPLGEIVLHQHHRRRWGRIFMYAAFAVTGGFFLITPSQYVTGKAQEPVVIAWALSILVGSLVCFIGAVSDRWIGEYAFLPITASGISLYGIALAVSIFDNGANPLVLPLGIFVLGVAGGLVGRWRDIQDLHIKCACPNQPKMPLTRAILGLVSRKGR